jgi:hypothetical protein
MTDRILVINKGFINKVEYEIYKTKCIKGKETMHAIKTDK